MAYYIMGKISGMQDDSPAKTVDSVYKMYIISGEITVGKGGDRAQKGRIFCIKCKKAGMCPRL